MTPSKILLYFCFSFIGGIFLGSFFRVPLFLILVILTFGILLISVFWPFGKLRASSGKKQLVVIGFCILFLVLGIWRHQSALSKIENSPLQNFLGKEITLIGIVNEEPKKKRKA